MSSLWVKINYQAVATLSKGLKDQASMKDYVGVKRSTDMLCKMLDEAIAKAKPWKGGEQFDKHDS